MPYDCSPPWSYEKEDLEEEDEDEDEEDNADTDDDDSAFDSPPPKRAIK